MQYCFAVPKNISRSSTHYFIMKIPNNQEFQQVVFNYSSDIDQIMDLYKNRILFLVLMLLLQQIILPVSERIF